MQETSTMTWSRLKEKLRAHGMPGWCDESPYRAPRDEIAAQVATWEGEGGRLAAPRAPFTYRLEGDVS
jgi:hypothetical protein